jgi:hypothetical protein
VFAKKTWVVEAIGEGKARGDEVGNGVTVGGTVLVIVGANAVWV